MCDLGSPAPRPQSPLPSPPLSNQRGSHMSRTKSIMHSRLTTLVASLGEITHDLIPLIDKNDQILDLEWLGDDCSHPSLPKCGLWVVGTGECEYNGEPLHMVAPAPESIVSKVVAAYETLRLPMEFQFSSREFEKITDIGYPCLSPRLIVRRNGKQSIQVSLDSPYMAGLDEMMTLSELPDLFWQPCERMAQDMRSWRIKETPRAILRNAGRYDLPPQR